MSETIVCPETISRGIGNFPCKCGGVAESAEGTPEERAKYGCGKEYDCCSAAWVCNKCGVRFVASLESPDMDTF